MELILSTGTALTIATTSGDAGQLGMAVGFDGGFRGRISLLVCPRLGAILGDFRRGNLFKRDPHRGDRPWCVQSGAQLGAQLGDLYLWFWQFLGLTGCLALGDRRYRRPLHYFFQHSGSQHSGSQRSRSQRSVSQH
ncbi:MAG: hypothetical protein DCF17_17210 [Shackletoniella antarctica]|uniref:Uncharacterized protein n=1 Tax=Shackletoniella antarctica TaxID=268115 RepID=A0A2W4VWZ0_9CYAN|nr:MAG: hypothetical protein DCF17_17210 [Shackletoniella antarctica]